MNYDDKAALELIGQMKPIRGETRAVCKCGYCGELFGRRYVPYGLGHGLTINPCSCIITNNQHGNYQTVLEVSS